MSKPDIDSEEFKRIYDQSKDIAARPLTMGMDPAAFANIVRARAGLLLFHLSETLKLNRDGLDTYANIMALLYTAGALTDKVPDLSMNEVMMGFTAGVRDVSDEHALKELAKNPKGSA